MYIGRFAHRRRPLAAASCLAAGLSLGPAPAAEPGEVARRLAAGWVLAEKRERLEERPGLPPYRDLVRRVLVTVYVLEKDGDRIRCHTEYDSQRDTIEETCGK